MNFSPKKWGSGGRVPPVEKKWGDAVPSRARPTTPLSNRTHLMQLQRMSMRHSLYIKCAILFAILCAILVRMYGMYALFSKSYCLLTFVLYID